MTLGTRIVSALILAAVVPMAVVIAVPLIQSDKRAQAETARRRDQARRQATRLLDEQRLTLARDADRAAADLGGAADALAAVVRGPEALARPVALRLAERYGLTRIAIVGEAGAPLATYGPEPDPASVASLVESRPVRAEREMLTLIASRDLGEAFAAEVGAVVDGQARLAAPGARGCPDPAVEIPVSASIALCVDVQAADARAVRRDLLGSFAGVAPVAVLVTLVVGFVMASRIARPIRILSLRAEQISAERSRPISLLPEQDETRRLTVAFDQMLDALAASERQRLAAERAAAWEEIARRLAHEIKNPLSPIQLAVENLRRARDRTPETFNRALDEETATILEEVGSLRALVDEFAQFARLPKPRIAACDPRAIVAGAVALFSARIAALTVRLTLDDAGSPRTIQADADQVGRVLKNVIANALDAMESSTARVLAIVVGARDGVLSIEIRDSGQGFEPEALRRVFEPYFTTRGDRGGTGLGMAIAYRIASEHGGSIRAEAAADGGAVITLLLPVEGPRDDRA
jgi:signal transduction histidine kinase